MKRPLARLATFALAIPLTVAGIGGSAQAALPAVTVPGCYGVQFDEYIVCDLTVVVHEPTAEVYNVWIKVCTGACGYVPVPVARPTSTGDVCFSWFDGYGNKHAGCLGSDSWRIDAGTILCMSAQNVCYVEDPSA